MGRGVHSTLAATALDQQQSWQPRKEEKSHAGGMAFVILDAAVERRDGYLHLYEVEMTWVAIDRLLDECPTSWCFFLARAVSIIS